MEKSMWMYWCGILLGAIFTLTGTIFLPKELKINLILIAIFIIILFLHTKYNKSN